MTSVDVHALALEKVGRILGPHRARTLLQAYLGLLREARAGDHRRPARVRRGARRLRRDRASGRRAADGPGRAHRDRRAAAPRRLANRADAGPSPRARDGLAAGGRRRQSVAPDVRTTCPPAHRDPRRRSAARRRRRGVRRRPRRARPPRRHPRLRRHRDGDPAPRDAQQVRGARRGKLKERAELTGGKRLRALRRAGASRTRPRQRREEEGGEADDEVEFDDFEDDAGQVADRRQRCPRGQQEAAGAGRRRSRARARARRATSSEPPGCRCSTAPA